jgi:hypothetical protein
MLLFSSESFVYSFPLWNLKNKIYEIITLPVFIWVWNFDSHTKGTTQIGSVWVQVLIIFAPKTEEMARGWTRLRTKELLITCGVHKILLGWLNQGGWDGGACSTHGTWEMHAKFYSGNLKETDHLEDLSVDAKIMLEWWRLGKVVRVLFLTEQHTMKVFSGSGGIAPLILWPRH